MPMRSLTRWFLPGCFVAALFLLMPARASAASFTITENGSGPVTLNVACTGCDLFNENPGIEPLVAASPHAEWHPGTSVPSPVSFNFSFCEAAGACGEIPPGQGGPNCSAIVPCTNQAPDLTGAGLDIVALFPNPIDNNGTVRNGYWATAGITSFVLRDLSTEPGPEFPVPVFGIPNLSDFLRLTFSNHVPTAADPATISLDGDFLSDSDVPEPASLVLLGTGLIGAGLRYRRRRKSA
jgi:PEP-CTERM motif-containing protein